MQLQEKASAVQLTEHTMLLLLRLLVLELELLELSSQNGSSEIRR